MHLIIPLKVLGLAINQKTGLRLNLVKPRKLTLFILEMDIGICLQEKTDLLKIPGQKPLELQQIKDTVRNLP